MNIDERFIGIAGDWHGNGRWAHAVINAFARNHIKTIFQVGDFGVWAGHNGQLFLDTVNDTCEAQGSTVYVTLGNHENYDYVEQLATYKSDEEGIIWARPNVAIFPRPFRFDVNGISFLSMGGAPSIDKEWRDAGKDWWPQEVITEEMEIEARNGGHAQVMLTHDAPKGGTPQVDHIINNNPQGWPSKMLNYCAEGRARMDRIVADVKPEFLFHGHYHVAGQGVMAQGTQVWSLNLDGSTKANAILDTGEMRAEYLYGGGKFI